MMKTMTDELVHKGEAARIAARQLAKVSGGVRNQALLNIADRIVDEQDAILDANRPRLGRRKAEGASRILPRPHDAGHRNVSRPSPPTFAASLPCPIPSAR